MRTTTFHDYQERVTRALLFIEGHLDHELALETLARVANFSPFHFHRIFRGMVGESIQAYIRRLRLERAATRLRFTPSPVTRIALDSGFDAHEPFTRAFKTRFGFAPSAYRKKFTPSRPSNAPPLPVEIVKIPAMRVAAIRNMGSYEKAAATFLDLFHWAETKALPIREVLGISYDDLEVTELVKARFDVCITIDEFSNCSSWPSNIFINTIAGRTYAKLRHNGLHERLHETYQALLGTWFPWSGFEPDSGGCLELYRNDPRTTPSSQLATDVCVELAES